MKRKELNRIIKVYSNLTLPVIKSDFAEMYILMNLPNYISQKVKDGNNIRSIYRNPSSKEYPVLCIATSGVLLLSYGKYVNFIDSINFSLDVDIDGNKLFIE